MNSEKILFTNILGVGKNGTTLMGSLLDNHPEISTFPMEMKFVEHYLNTIKDKFQTKCEHNFCKSCLGQWLEKNNSCPMCREVLIDNSNFEEHRPP